ncbi:MAG TPA: FAD-binding oxidoreductase, partial [Planctomycetia bacterium]|nr:FAD-binding oxidoreductase [Planctomycetia bacterium]
MEARADQVADDLRDLIRGEVLADDVSRALYATDASIFSVRPLVVAAPRDVEELAALVKYTKEENIALQARGAGTGLAGESLGAGIAVDLTRHFRGITSLASDRVRVQCGVRWAVLQDALAVHGRSFGPDPLSGDACTIGGMIATDAAGPRSLRYGATGDHALRLTMVLADGSIVEVGRETVRGHGPLTFLAELSATLREAAPDILREQPSDLRRPGGYHLRGVVHGDIVDVPRLIAGSEGTLAIVAEAVLGTSPIPPHRGLLLAAFDSVEAALDSALA